MAQNTTNPNHLIIGLGGTGGLVLKAFKKRLYKEFPDEAERSKMIPAIEFLYVDSTRDDLMNDDGKDVSWKVFGKNVAFTEKEFFNIKSGCNSISQVLDSISNNPQSYQGLRYVVKNGEAMKQTVGEIDKAAGQKRRAGRIMFAFSCAKFLDAVAAQVNSLKQRTFRDSMHFHVFTGLAGGTGSGSIVDVAAQLRKKYPEAEIDIYAMVPEVEIPGNFDAGRYHQNGYAALSELSALNVRSFLPCDVITGEEHISLPERKKQFGLVLYSNVNSNGVVVGSRTVLPELVADALHLRIFLPQTDSTSQFFRTWSCENVDEHLVEFSEKGKELIPVRTKAIASFGIKRLCYPEQLIEEHISYTIAKKIVLQMQYNNFKEEGLGFIGEPVKKDYSEFVKDQAKLISWKLDEKHLMLEKAILDSDRKVEDFKTFWDSQTQWFSYDEAKANNPEPLMEIETHCKEQFDSNFRLKQGVVDYFKDKSQERALKEQVDEILDKIETDLFANWHDGKYSMYDLVNICDVITEYIKKCINDNDKLMDECRKRIDEYTEDLDANTETFNHLSLAQRAIGKSSKVFSDHQSILADLYVNKTIEVALAFRSSILLRLRNRFEDLSIQINGFVGRLAKSQEKLEQEIAARQKKEGELDVRETTVYVYEEDKMLRFEDKLSANKTRMDALASIIRKKLAGERSFAHFGDMAKNITDSTMTEIADQFLTPEIIAIHDTDDCFMNDKILGLNILQLLQKLHVNGELGGELNRFSKDIASSCGVFVKFSDKELNRKLNNNPNPLVDSHSILRKSILISMPEPSSDDSVKVFADEFRTSLKSAFPAQTSISFYDKSERKNEITLVEVNSIFPVRCLDALPFFKQKYLASINNENEKERNQARILLHSEGDGTNLPSLEGEGNSVSTDDFVSYLFIAAAIGKIAWATDEKEYDGWCIVEEDEWGSKINRLLSTKFTEIISSENFTSEIKSSIIEEVDEFLEHYDLKKSEKEALASKAADVMRNYVVKECSSPTSPMYQKYSNAAKAAISKLNK